MRAQSCSSPPLALAASACGSSPAAGPWNTDPGVSGHQRYFPIAGTAHDPSAAGATVSGDACHPGNTFAQFDCATCHDAARTDPIHGGVSGYVHASADCLRCHPDGTAPAPGDHDTRFFPRGPGSAHAAVGGQCSGCHADLSAPTDPARFECDTCHATRTGFATAHAGVTGFTAGTRSADRLKCHGDGQVDRVSAHQSKFAIVKGSATHDTVCLQCHTSMRTDKTLAADFATFACTACHDKTSTDGRHTGNADYDVYRTDKPFGLDFASDPQATSKVSGRKGCYECHGSAPPRGD